MINYLISNKYILHCNINGVGGLRESREETNRKYHTMTTT